MNKFQEQKTTKMSMKLPKAESSMSNDIEVSSVEVFETPDKSENDKKSYRVIRLENGIKALLISDSNRNSTLLEDDEKREKLAACSLCVDVGSFSDPRDVQGLAHFLEHMIFMGLGKYPSENEFKQFMQKSGGCANASTLSTETIFYFLTREEFLDEALDRFSQFFKAPLMLKEAMTREREAVDSEFALKKSRESVRRSQLLSMVAQASHPLSIFSWGNLETLKENFEDEVLYQKVHDFRKRHYSAHRMYLCLQSNLPLDDLQELANRHFSNIPNNKLPGDDFSQYSHQNALQSKFFEKVFFVKPIANVSKLDITWCLESMIKNFKCKPGRYLIQILRHEDKGSLLSYLRKRLWAVDLDVSGNDSPPLFSIFNICVHLTDDGFDHLDDVLSAIFSYLKLLQVAGPKESIFRDIQTIKANAFRFSDECDELDNVKDLVASLKYYSPKYILNGDSLLFEYDANAIQQMTDELNSRKFNIMITSTRRYNDQVTFELTEPWCGTRYSEINMPEKWISLWKNATPSPEFALPEPNPFIADDFTILYEGGHPTKPKYPTKILDNEMCELWYRQDDKFLLPTACYNFYFMIPHANDSSENMIQMGILTKALRSQLVEKLYLARAASLGYLCHAASLRLVFGVSGFSQKLHLMVDAFSKCLKSLAETITEKQFEVFVQQKFKDYENVVLEPEDFANDLRCYVIDSQDEPIYQMNKRLRSVNFADFQHFCRKFCEQVRIKVIMQGNISKEHALSVMNNVLNELNCGKVADLSSIGSRATKLPVGANYLRFKIFNPKDVNTVITNFYQIGPYSRRIWMLMELLTMVAREPMFDQLRTKEQLAYGVSFVLHDDYGIFGYSITVKSQESKFTVDHVDDRIENFRRKLATIIEAMNDNDFENIKASRVKIKMCADNKLAEEVSRNWVEIVSGRYEFDRQQKGVECLSTITKAELLEFYRANLGEAERKLSVQVIGNAQEKGTDVAIDVDKESDMDDNLEMRRKRFDALTYVNFNGEPRGNLIHDLIEFKNSLEVYRVIN